MAFNQFFKQRKAKVIYFLFSIKGILTTIYNIKIKKVHIYELELIHNEEWVLRELDT